VNIKKGYLKVKAGALLTLYFSTKVRD